MNKPVPLKVKYFIQTETLFKLDDTYFEVVSNSDGQYFSRQLDNEQVRTWDEKKKIRIQNG